MTSCLAAASAQATWPGKNGAVAFTRNSHIWIELPSGKQRQLTRGERPDGQPTYSRDGRLIAFVRYSEGNSDIWLMNSDGTNQHPVAETEAWETDPAFFPSGRSLVFSTSSPSGGWKVFSIRTDGTGLRELANRAKFPAVSPDGRWLAYQRHPGGDRIRLQDLRTGAERQLASGHAQEPDFSPDGRRLVFVGQRPCGTEGRLRLAMLTIGLQARHPRTLLSTCRRRFIPYGPVWSPRGNRILFTRRQNPSGVGTVRLQMLNLRGVLVAGAPRHRSGTFEGSPSWQALR